MSARPFPVPEAERIAALDTLRGFALLGILVMNIQSFAMPFAAYFNPTVYGNLEGTNYWVWVLGHVLFDQKFMTIFSMLFGAGVVLFTSRLEARGEKPAPKHYRRTLWLILFGAAHAYLLWYGDILFLYGMCALLVYFARRLSPRTLLILGLLVISVSSLISFAGGFSMPSWPPEELKKFAEDWAPPPELIAAEVAAYQGGWLAQMPDRVKKSWEFQTFVIFVWGLWRAGGLMLVGMGLYKLGVFSAERSRAFYARLFALGVLTGVPVVAYGVYRNFAANWDLRYSFFFGGQYNYWGSIAVSLGWVGMVMLACKTGAARWLTRRLAAVGQIAFTNYLLHTIFCTTIFYGHGLGLFGRLPRVGQAAVVAAVWVLQLLVSPVWLRHFHFGPFEWLWRSLTYGELQPLRRSALPVASAEA